MDTLASALHDLAVALDQGGANNTHRRGHHRRHGAASSSDCRVYENRGTPYAVTQKEIDVIQDRNKRYYPPHAISGKRAVQQLVNAHAPGVHLDRDQASALDRLQALGNLRRWGPDIAIKAFNDLDKIFFMGKLRGHVYVYWEEGIHEDGAGCTYDAGDFAPRITICLNSHVHMSVYYTLRDMWSTLLHEMIHAYLFLMVGRLVNPTDKGGHGRCFVACMKALQYRIGNPDFIKLTIYMNECTRPKIGGFQRNDDGRGSRGHRPGWSGRARRH